MKDSKREGLELELKALMVKMSKDFLSNEQFARIAEIKKLLVIKYQPSNGTEGMAFIDKNCDNCKFHDPTDKMSLNCDVMALTFAFDKDDDEYPLEWCYDEKDKPQCTKRIVFDWSKGKVPEPEINDPNQLELF